MLAESESRALFEEAFDMGYNWEGHHLMNGLAQGKTSVQEWDNYMKKVDSTYQDDDILMNFITNHDENSWNGTVKERMGDAGEAMLVMSYAIPGMPLIYSGQEYGMDKRLKFFEKDTIPKQKGHIWNIMERLALVKNKNPALHGGKNAAAYNRLKTTNDAAVYAFERINEGRRVVYMVNTTKEPVEFQIPTVSGKLIELTRGGEVTTKEGTSFKFPPYGYRLFEVVK
jgi:1,4-alpha-glucan branching enzyme